jgi:diketogulonate reductase-like aldo/keto reductase
MNLKTVTLPCGVAVPALGQGTWNMGESRAARKDELAALRLGMDLGLTLIDTAEMYGEGAAEELIAEALAGRRDEAIIVSKVYPHNASRKGTAAACERSLKRLNTDHIDLYLLHWRGNIPLDETMQALDGLKQAGKILHYGVSNLDLADMRETWETQAGQDVQVNQLLYNLTRRGIEWDLLPWMREHKVPLMAYSPIEQARLLRNKGLQDFAKRNGWTPAQAALAWLLDRDNIIAIPKTGSLVRVRENHGALNIKLDDKQRAELDALFPPPKGPRPLEML